MPNKKNIKEVKVLSESLSKAKAVYFTEYHGLNVGDITKLRSEFFKANVEYRVAKNTLVKLAAAVTPNFSSISLTSSEISIIFDCSKYASTSSLETAIITTP